MSINFLSGVTVSADALKANKIRTDLIAQNIANAQTTKDVDGNAYKRKIAVFESYMNTQDTSDPLQKSVKVSAINSDSTPGDKIYDPGHPHADSNGMVEQSNVKTAQEMVDLIATSHAYEANLSVISTARQMAQQTLSIGK